MDVQRISHYRVERLLGVGGMGEVYLAEDSTLRRKVALKLLPERFSDDAERVRRFQREARAASKLNHPNIITIYEVGQAESRHYIATEFIEGETLRARINAKTPMSIADVIDIGIGVANALGAAHEAGILHRDIKPENIMLRPDGYVKVLDFGLAKLIEGDGALKDSNTGSIMGTLLYISPEQARGSTPDSRSDIYSLGAVLYEAVTRNPPISTDSFFDLAIAIATRDPLPPSKVVKNVPAELDHIIMKALQKDPAKRYANAREMMQDLRTLRTTLEFENKLYAIAGDSDTQHRLPSLAQQQTALLSYQPHPNRLVMLWQTRRTPFMTAIALLLALAAFAVAYTLMQGDLGSRPIESVAVLPFTNASGDPNSEYLSDGISESIIDSLSQLPQLQVVARSTVFRYKGKNIDPLEVGKELSVRGVVSGQVIARGNTLVIRVALTDVKRGTQVWGEQYDRKLADVLTVQQEMAQEISGKLRMKLTGLEKKLLTKRNADSSEAFQLYLKGRYYRNKYNEEAIRKAIGFFNQAIERDPTYALAYAGLADAYFGLSNLYMAPRDAMPRVREAARRALALDDSLAQAHTSLALVLVWFDWDYQAGEREFLRAIELNPNDAEAHRLYGSFLTALGRYDAALVQDKKAEQIDPLSVPASWDVGRALFYAGRLADAKEQVRRTIELDDHFTNAYFLAAEIASQEGNYASALALTQTAFAHAPSRTPLLVSAWGYFNACAGNRAEAEKAIAELKSRPSYTLPLFLARVNAGMGNKDEAMRWLEQAYADRSESVMWLKVDPTFANLRGDPRFDALIKKVGLT